jgi:glycine dehydrogenase subunit 1
MRDLLKRNKLSYIPATDEDRAQMLEAIGVPNVDAIFEQIPKDLQLTEPLNVPEGISEQDILTRMEELAGANTGTDKLVSFLGAGAYDHYIPSVVDAVVSRSEFYTAYTPYQPEASQGLLQTIYEYQSMICALTGMDMSNASLYDAGTAIGEAAILAANATGKSRIIVSKTVHPNYRQVLTTYTRGLGIAVDEAEYADGITEVSSLKECLKEDAAAVVVQYPNFFGAIDPLPEIVDAAHAAGALIIVCVDPIALGMLTSPGELGADIVVGEGQSLGIPTGFGGPFLGIFACKKEHMWRIPGRIVGATVDSEGTRSFTLTLQTREQHIRREKATSNICTNQALMALAATVYLSALGKNGIKHVAELCYHKAHYAHKQICTKAGFSNVWSAPFFKEFVVRTDLPVSEINDRLLENGILGGLNLGVYYPELENHMLFCVTERRSKEQIDRLVEQL